MAVQISGAQIKAAALTASNINFTGSQNWHFASAQSLRWQGTATNDDDLVTKKDLDGIAAGLHWKDSCRTRSVANVNIASPGASINGISLNSGDRVLLADQTDASQNGIYNWNGSASAMTRSADMNAAAEFPGAALFVREGTQYADTGWTCTNDAVTLGSTDIAFVQFAGTGTVVAGSGLTKSGNTLSAVANGSTINITGSGIKVADASLSNAQISNSAAIAYSKLSLTGSIVNGDLAGSIADSKLLQITTANKVAGTAVQLRGSGGLTQSGSGLEIAAGGVSATMLAGSIPNSKLSNSSLTVSDGGSSTAIALGGTITYSGSGAITVSESSGTITYGAQDASTSQKGVAQFNSTHFGASGGTISANNLTVTAGSGLAGGGAVTLGGTVTVNANVDDTTIEVVGDALRIKNSGVSLAKISYRPYMEGALASGAQTTLDLARPLTANWDAGVQVTKNGLMLRNMTALGGSASDSDEFTVSLTGGAGSNARVTFGGGLVAGDAIVVSYIA
tara:strand:+ start:1371 stop:2894 length:1524 start_codon:yes stop_codon:yes gene_type:complete